MSAETWVQNQLEEFYFRGGPAPTQPTAYYIGLIDEDGNEASGGAYARVQYNPTAANWDAAPAVANSNVITFPAPTDAWQPVGKQLTHMAFFDAATAGNRFFTLPLANPKTVNGGDPAPNFPVGALAPGVI